MMMMIVKRVTLGAVAVAALFGASGMTMAAAAEPASGVTAAEDQMQVASTRHFTVFDDTGVSGGLKVVDAKSVSWVAGEKYYLTYPEDTQLEAGSALGPTRIEVHQPDFFRKDSGTHGIEITVRAANGAESVLFLGVNEFGTRSMSIKTRSVSADGKALAASRSTSDVSLSLT